MKTILYAVYLNIYGGTVPVTIEIAPIMCASLIQDFYEDRDPRIELANGETSPPLKYAACVEMKG